MRLLAAAALLLASVAPAHAYIDAGSGSYALQVGLALAFAGVFTLKAGWRRACDFVRRTTGAVASGRPGRHA